MNECLENALSELEAVGIKPEVAHGGKHIRVYWQHNNQMRSHTVPVTPSDWRSAANNRAQLRSTLKKDGYFGAELEPVVDTANVAIRRGQSVVSSLDIARHFEKAHKDVLRSIDRILPEVGEEFAGRNFALSDYIDQTGRTLRAYDMTRDGFAYLVMGFSGSAAAAWKIRYLEAFNAMERELLALAPTNPAIEARIKRLENDLEALTELALLPTPEPGLIIIKPYKRRVRGSRAA